MMEPQGTKNVYEAILARINKQGGKCSEWYVGITSDWENRLFNEHQVPRKDHWWIALQCFNAQGARNVEDALLKLGCDGASGGGDSTSVYVYAYLKASMTNP